MDLHATYLGLPFFSRKSNSNYWNYIVEKVQKKLAGWKGKLLSLAGKIQLLKASLQNILIYYLPMFSIPAYIVDRIEKIQRRFLWSGVEERKRNALIKWDKVCVSKKGGLGIRRLKVFNKALVAKMGWFLLEDEKIGPLSLEPNILTIRRIVVF